MTAVFSSGTSITSAWLNQIDSLSNGLSTVDTTGVIDATTVLNTEQARIIAAYGGGVMVLPVGTILLTDFQWDPRISITGKGRGRTIIKTNAASTQAAIVSLPRFTTNSSKQAYGPFIANLNIDGNNAGTLIDGILATNANTDPAYPGDTSKPYSAPRIHNVEIYDCSGIGIEIQAGRHRFYMEDTRVTGCNSHGVKLGASDPVIGPRCAAGNNKGHGIYGVSAAGIIMTGVNVWGNPATRSDSCLGVKFQNVNGITISGCVFNDTIAISGTNGNDDRAVSITGCDFRPLNSLFSANGVPTGTASAQYNAFINVNGYDLVQVSGNDFNLTNQQFAGVGWGFDTMLTATNTACVNFNYSASSQTGTRPWASTSTLPYTVDGTSSVTCYGSDVYAGIVRLNGSATGTVAGPVVVNADGTYTPSSAYGFVVNHPTNLPSQFLTPTDFSVGVQYSSTFTALVNNATVTISDSSVYNVLTGAGVANHTVKLPANPRDGTVRYIAFVGAVTNLTISPNTGQSIFIPPTTAIAGQSYAFIYHTANTTWYRVGG